MLLLNIFLLLTPFAAHAGTPKINYGSGGGTSVSGAFPTFPDWLDPMVGTVSAEGGDYELYENENYSGRRIVVESSCFGDGDVILEEDDVINSLRPVCWFSKGEITLYQESNGGGESKTVEYGWAAENNLRYMLRDAFDGAVSSVRVTKGTWEFYSNENFSGTRQVVEAGDGVVNVDSPSSSRPTCN